VDRPVHPLSIERLFGTGKWPCPEIVSLTILIGATLPVRGARLVGQAAIVSIWFWAGLNKALSTGWDDVASTLAGDAGNASLRAAFYRTDRLRRSPRWALAAAGVLLVVPVGWYLGILDSYLTYQLYTGNTRTAEICAPDGTCRTNEFDTASLNVPLPPEPRIYRSIFEKTCQPGETLVLHPRLTRVLGGNPDDVTIVQCPR
jgi:hypothetical protein